MAIKFKDVSSFSQDSTDRTPRSFVAYVGGLCLVVTRRRDYPGQWKLSCDPFFETAIDDCPAEDAQRQAVTLLRDTLAEAIKLLG